MKFWVDRLVDGVPFSEISKAFYSAGIQFSDQTGYSASMTNDDFVKIIYENVLGRTGATAPSTTEIEFWTGGLNSGAISKDALIQEMLSAARTYVNNAQWGWVTDLLDNKIEIGRIHSVEFGMDYAAPQNAILETVAIVDAVTPTSIEAALKIIGVIDSNTLA